VELFSTQTAITDLPTDPFTGVSQVVQIFTSGNSTLKPETGKTTTLGLVYRPEWAPRFGVSVDYYDIRISGAVATPPFQDIINDCFRSGGTAGTCAVIDKPFPITNRTPANTLTAVHQQPLNLSFIKTRGVDIDASYSFDLEGIASGLDGGMA